MARRSFQIRLLPVTIFVALLMFMVRVGDIWKGLSSDGVPVVSVAELRAQQPPAPAAPAGPQPLKVAQGPVPAAPSGPLPEPAQSPPADLPVPIVTGEPGEGAGFTQNEIELLQRLAERREGLEARARELDMREGLLKAAESRIDKKIAELKDLQAAIDSLIRKHGEQEDAKMASLVKIYENMKPKDAARIFEQLDMPILLDVLERMSERKVAPIMAEMDPAKAKSVTAELAKRRQLPQPAQSQEG